MEDDILREERGWKRGEEKRKRGGRRKGQKSPEERRGR